MRTLLALVAFVAIFAVGPVTTQKPTAPPTPATPANGTWYVNDTETVCVILKVGIRFNLTYIDTKNKTQVLMVDLPAKNTSQEAKGHCGKNTSDSQQITLSFFKTWNFTLDFVRKDKQFHVQTITLFYDETKAPFPKDVKNPKKIIAQLVNQTLWQARVGNSYLCITDQTYNLSSNTLIRTYNLQVEAFRDEKTDLEFGDAQECAADLSTNNIVPIAVGAALAALVVIVLIAYLISRNRNKGGYESV